MFLLRSGEENRSLVYSKSPLNSCLPSVSPTMCSSGLTLSYPLCLTVELQDPKDIVPRRMFRRVGEKSCLLWSSSFHIVIPVTTENYNIYWWCDRSSGPQSLWWWMSFQCCCQNLLEHQRVIPNWTSAQLIPRLFDSILSQRHPHSSFSLNPLLTSLTAFTRKV